MKNNIIRLLPVIIYSLLIFYMSHQPQPVHVEFGFEWQDKIQHFAAFVLYGFALLYALKNTSRPIVYTLIIGCLYGASDEIHQYFVPNRSSEFLDWFADCFGVFFSAGIYQLMKRKKKA